MPKGQTGSSPPLKRPRMCIRTTANSGLRPKRCKAVLSPCREDARTLIEGVFGDDVGVSSGAATRRQPGDRIGFRRRRASANEWGQRSTLGYVRGGVEWCSEAKAPSRLGEASMNVVLARWEADRLVPWCTHDNLRHAWAYSTVRVAERLIAKTAEPEESAPAECIASRPC
jgi:CRISPR-associated endonuclease/helicase Cas3